MSLSWTNDLIAEYSGAAEWRNLFRMGPTHTREVIFGFLLRLFVSIVAVITASVPIVVAGLLNHWHLTNTLLFLYGFLICTMILCGEHLRSRMYERVVAMPNSQFIGEDDNTLVYKQDSDEPNSIAKHTLEKRIFDIIVGGAVLSFLSPVLIVIAVAVRFDSPGPITFRQKRRGYDRKEFTIAKFRTMKILDDVSNSEITRVGKYLRMTNMDELPQLFSVLNGSMSLVGPRPLSLHEGGQYNAQEIQPLIHVKPGITGWAQIHGLRGVLDDPRWLEIRLRYDLWYATHWSLFLDLRILLRTLFLGLPIAQLQWKKLPRR